MSLPCPPRTYGVLRKAVYSKHILESTTRLAGGDSTLAILLSVERSGTAAP